MTGLWAFETQMPFQKYQGPPIVVRWNKNSNNYEQLREFHKIVPIKYIRRKKHLPYLRSVVSLSRRQDFMALSTRNTTQYLQEKRRNKIKMLGIISTLDNSGWPLRSLLPYPQCYRQCSDSLKPLSVLHSKLKLEW